MRLPKLFLLVSIVAGLATTARAEIVKECVYLSAGVDAEIDVHADCATLRDGALVFHPEHLDQMAYSERGLAVVLVDRQHYYVKPDGTFLPVVTHDNGADEFSEGLTRSRVGDRIALFDSTFRQVIPPIYDWAWPFEGGRALVCRGCRAVEPDQDGHTSVTGGSWGYVDRQGKEVVPVRFTQEEARKQR